MTKTSSLAWIRFLRLPAVLTVPGDVLVGAAVLSKAFPWMEMAAVCSAYLFGMALNDLRDLPADRQDRPERPLPQGNLSLARAKWVCFGLGLFSLLFNPVLSQGILLILIVLYTEVKNTFRVAGAFLMAACRCAAIYIGGGSEINPSMLFPLLLWASLIILITWLADFEDSDREGWYVPSVLLTVLWLGSPFAGIAFGSFHFSLFLPWAFLLVLALRTLRRIHARHHVNPQDIGIWLSMLIPLQSIFLISLERKGEGIALLLLWPLLKWSIRKIRIS